MKEHIVYQSPTTSPRSHADWLFRTRRASRPGSPRFCVTERDREVIKAVYEDRVLDGSQVKHLLFLPSQGRPNASRSTRCASRLKLLFQAGYLARQEQAQKLSEGRKAFLYLLAKKGATLLVNKLLAGEKQVDWKAKDNRILPLFLEHLLATNSVRIAFVLATWRHGLIVEKWLDERTLKRPENRDYVILPGSMRSGFSAKRVPVLPDGYFVLRAGKRRGRMWPGPNGEGLSRAHLVKACEDSLRRLGTDRIDLYQTHAFDADTPIDETLQALDDLVRAGKVLYIGASNIPAWRLTKALWVSDKLNLARYDCLQPHYNLAHRAEFERELMPLCAEEGIGVIPYSPLAGGFLTGKYRGNRAPAGARAESIRARYLNDRGFALLDAIDGVARTHSATPAQVSLAWLLRQPAVTAPIVGATELSLAPEELASLNAASAWE